MKYHVECRTHPKRGVECLVLRDGVGIVAQRMTRDMAEWLAARLNEACSTGGTCSTAILADMHSGCPSCRVRYAAGERP